MVAKGKGAPADISLAEAQPNTMIHTRTTDMATVVTRGLFLFSIVCISAPIL
jgi:hypothetical protein